MLDGRALLRSMMDTNHQILEGTMADVTGEVAHWSPPGQAVPIGAMYAHVIIGEDFLLSGLRGTAPIGASTFAGKMGVSEPPPPASGTGWSDWAHRVRVDLTALRAYAQAVYANTDAYLASASDAELDKVGKHPLSGMLPDMSPAAFVGNLLSGHVANHCGEISALKGEQGLKGYPF